jgi:hypothetical protein
VDTSFRSVQRALKRSADYLEGELKCTSVVCVSPPMFELRCPKVDGRLLACQKGPAVPNVFPTRLALWRRKNKFSAHEEDKR